MTMSPQDDPFEIARKLFELVKSKATEPETQIMALRLAQEAINSETTSRITSAVLAHTLNGLKK